MAAYPNTPSQSRSLVGLFSDLFRETSTLVHEEAQLAKAEISEKVSQLGAGVAAIAPRGAIMLAGF
ncbi:MAG TPA: phage holin family protein, partial [Burkholderiales bacterium]|nr:phage holin family protein [Burkholderiales bacterium]